MDGRDAVMGASSTTVLVEGRPHQLVRRAIYRLDQGLPEELWHVGAPCAVAVMRFENRIVTIFDLDRAADQDPLAPLFLHVVEIGTRLVGLLTRSESHMLPLPRDLLLSSPEFEPVSGFAVVDDDVGDVVALPEWKGVSSAVRLEA
ncbi:hypothetical protein [Alsobacter sp. R-9]